MHIVPAPDALTGLRFDVAIAKMLGVSRAKAAVLIETEQVGLMHKQASKSDVLTPQDMVRIDLAEEQTVEEPVSDALSIVYEDDDLVIVNKPVGVAAHASIGWTGPTVLGSLLHRGVAITSCGAAGRQGIVSRLDVGTSGLMLVCKSELAYRVMRRQFSEHEVQKNVSRPRPR